MRDSPVYDDVSRPPLDVAALRRSLVTGPLGGFAELVVLPETGSTNAELMRLAEQGAADLTVVIAEHQTAGRGRLGRTWTAPPRSQVALSVLVRRGSVAPPLLGWAPLVTGLALADALREVGRVRPRLKWPNDVMVDDPERAQGRKLAGILVEMTTVPSGGDFALRLPALVVGLGLNVSLRAEELPVPHATSLALEGGLTDRDTLVRAVLRAVETRFAQWSACEHGSGSSISDELLAEYTSACATVGSEVRVELPDGTAPEGRADGVDRAGRLLVRTRDGAELAVAAGDVTHVRAAGRPQPGGTGADG